jgi:hypothetical protein
MATKDDIIKPDEVHGRFKENRATYERVAEGLGSIYTSEDHKDKLKKCAQEALELMDLFEKAYTALYQSLDSSRSKKINPKYVDIKLVRFLSDYFEIPLPESGKYGVLDTNRTLHRAFSVYIRENHLNNKQFFTLDERLRSLFSCSSLEEPSKTYLDLTQERVDTLAKDKEKITPSCSNIIRHGDTISMNVAALKILVPKFGLDYSPADADKYVNRIQEFVDLLDERFEKAKAKDTKQEST